MADDPKSSSKDRGLDLHALIGAPLVAVSQANRMMAREQAKFIMEFCFAKEGDNYVPVTVPLTLTQSFLSSDGPGEPVMQSVSTVIHLPILTIIPINSLAIDTVDLDFTVDITGQEDALEEAPGIFGGPSSTSASLTGKIGPSSEAVGSSGSKAQPSSSAKLSVSINAGPLPLPVGVTTLLQLYSKSIQPSKLPLEHQPEKNQTDNPD